MAVITNDNSFNENIMANITKQKTSQELDADIDELNLKLAECQVPEVTTNTYLTSFI